MNTVRYYSSGKFLDYNHIILNQISYMYSNDMKISSLDSNVDVFKNFIFESVIYNKRLYIYNFFDDIFYEIVFNLSVCNYIMIQNNILVNLNYNEITKKIILKLDKGIVYFVDEKIEDIPFILNLQNLVEMLSVTNNFKEVKHSEDLNIKDDKTFSDEEMFSKKKNFKIRKYGNSEFIVYDTNNVFKIKDNEIENLKINKKCSIKKKIYDCLNMTNEDLLLIIERKDGTLKYYIFTKSNFEYIKYNNITDVISHLQNYYNVLRDSIYIN